MCANTMFPPISLVEAAVFRLQSTSKRKNLNIGLGITLSLACSLNGVGIPNLLQIWIVFLYIIFRKVRNGLNLYD